MKIIFVQENEVKEVIEGIKRFRVENEDNERIDLFYDDEIGTNKKGGLGLDFYAINDDVEIAVGDGLTDDQAEQFKITTKEFQFEHRSEIVKLKEENISLKLALVELDMKVGG